MTKRELETLWERAGGPSSSAGLAASIALAESSGNPGSTNHNTDGSTDRGLWQINSVHGSQSTYDIFANARAAVAISNGGTNFTPWVTYKTGAYRQYLGASPGTGSPTSSTTSTSEPAGINVAAHDSTGGLLGTGIKAIFYIALLAGAAALIWLGTKTSLQPRKAAA